MMHCKFPHCRTTGQRTLPRCVQITSSGESASVWEDKDLTFYTSIFNVLALTWTSVVMLAGHIEHSLWWGRAVESSVSSSVCQQVLQPRLPRLWALTTQRKGCSCIETYVAFSNAYDAINHSGNLPADQIFNILSQEPLQNCVRATQIALIDK